MQTAQNYVEVNGVSRHFASESGKLRALDGLSCAIRSGEFVSVLGPSGCGKSTLLMLIAGLQRSSAGKIVVDEIVVDRPQTNVGIVFQSPVLMAWRNVLDNVLVQIEMRRGLEKGRYRNRARQLLKAVGLEGFESHMPYQLSGGMRQRVAICRALIHDPPLLLMDEPFGALDELTRDQLMVDVQSMCAQGGKTVLFITHSIREALFLSDRVIVMTPRPGRIDTVIDIELERPRRLAVQETQDFMRYARTIRERFLAHGVLRDVSGTIAIGDPRLGAGLH